MTEQKRSALDGDGSPLNPFFDSLVGWLASGVTMRMQIISIFMLNALVACTSAPVTVFLTASATPSVSIVAPADAQPATVAPVLKPTDLPPDTSRSIHLPPANYLYHGVYPGGYTGEENDLTLDDLHSYEEAAGKKSRLGILLA